MNESRKRHIIDGYGHLIREAIRSRAENIRNELYPNYYMGVHGIIISNNAVKLIIHEVDVKVYSSILKDNFVFTSFTCFRKVSGSSILCSSCEQ